MSAVEETMQEEPLPDVIWGTPKKQRLRLCKTKSVLKKDTNGRLKEMRNLQP